MMRCAHYFHGAIDLEQGSRDFSGMSAGADTLHSMEPLTGIVAAFAVLVVSALVGLIVKGTASFLFDGIAQISRGVFVAVVWLISKSLQLLWWLVIGWWWRRWVSPPIW